MKMAGALLAGFSLLALIAYHAAARFIMVYELANTGGADMRFSAHLPWYDAFLAFTCLGFGIGMTCWPEKQPKQ